MLIILGIVGEVVRSKFIVSGSAAATAANLVSMQLLWHVGIAAELLALICAIALAMIYYVLFKPVSRELNVLATFIRFAAIAVQLVAVENLVAALFPLGDAIYLKAFTPEQLNAMMFLSIKSHAHGYNLSLLLFGCCFLVHGWLIFESGFLPGVLGRLIQVAGICYVTNSLATLMAPAFAGIVFPYILIPSFIGELSLCLWLIVKGIHVQRWKERAGPAVDAQAMAAM
jgi:Domain of unknown function (DUF4386)